MLSPGTELYAMYHTLWTKAVGTQGYDKNEWAKFGELIKQEAAATEAGKLREALTPVVPLLEKLFRWQEAGFSVVATEDRKILDTAKAALAPAKTAAASPHSFVSYAGSRCCSTCGHYLDHELHQSAPAKTAEEGK